MKGINNTLKYSFFLLCLHEIGLTNTVYYKNFLNCLIIEFLKLGKDLSYLQEATKEEQKEDLAKITQAYFDTIGGEL